MATQDLTKLPLVTFPDGTTVPALGIGTWKMGESKAKAAREAEALSLGIDLGMTVIDTAEMYADGRAEEVVARASAGRRDRVFVVSKVYPHNAGRKNAISACERSLERLKTDRLDLYLLHWRGKVPLAETVEAFERLRADGKILRWGVSNFDTADMRELYTRPEGRQCATNQVLYHLAERGIEWELLPWMRERHLPVMAYSPLGQGSLLAKPKLVAIAKRLGATPAQFALAWLMRASLARGAFPTCASEFPFGRPGGELGRSPDVLAIPESADLAHVRANRDAAALRLDPETLQAIDAAFPPPSGPTPLAMI